MDPAPDSRPDADWLLADLDADQRRAVTTESRVVAVLAGAGSGKTRVLTRRLAHRVLTGSADARHALVLTFTREAAGELRRRLPSLGLTERVAAGTFHSIAHGLLRQRWADQGKRPREMLGDRDRLYQLLINLGMNLNVIPVAGLPMPFISSGGSALVVTFLGLGLVESVAMRQHRLDL